MYRYISGDNRENGISVLENMCRTVIQHSETLIHQATHMTTRRSKSKKIPSFVNLADLFHDKKHILMTSGQEIRDLATAEPGFYDICELAQALQEVCECLQGACTASDALRITYNEDAVVCVRLRDLCQRSEKANWRCKCTMALMLSKLRHLKSRAEQEGEINSPRSLPRD